MLKGGALSMGAHSEGTRKDSPRIDHPAFLGIQLSPPFVMRPATRPRYLPPAAQAGMRFFPVDRPPVRAEAPHMPSKQEILDLQFIEARHKLLDLAAFLDRIDRHPGDNDFRLEAMKNALPILLAERPDRARAILEALSDPTTEPIPQAAFQGAFGAPSLITDH